MIKLVAEKEIDQLIKMLHAVIKQMHAIGKTHWNDIYPNKEVLLNDIRRGEAYGYYMDDQMVAYMTLNEDSDPQFEDVNWLCPNAKHLIIHRLMVHPTYQGKGIAKECMLYACQWAKEKGYDSVRLDTLISDKITQHIYTSAGFTQLDIIEREGWGKFYCYEKPLTIC